MGYVSGALAVTIAGNINRPLQRVVTLSLIASFIVGAWDLSLVPDWNAPGRQRHHRSLSLHLRSS
jgi:hypothetical protein